MMMEAAAETQEYPLDVGELEVIEIAGLSGLIAFVVASMVVGARILLLAARTRLFPETAVGLSLFLAGGVGTALLIVPLFLPESQTQAGYVFYQFGSAISHVGFGLLFFFVWRVFRREETWAAILYGLCTTGLLFGGMGIAVELQPEQILSGRSAPNNIWFWMSLSARFVGYGWAAIESFRYYGMLKKRLELGLAEASVVSRFFYWGVCVSAVVCIWVNMAVQQVIANDPAVQASSHLVSAVLGFVVAGSLWVAFFPRASRIVASGVDDHAGHEYSS